MHDFIIDKNHKVVEQATLVQVVCRSVKFMHSYNYGIPYPWFVVMGLSMTFLLAVILSLL